MEDTALQRRVLRLLGGFEGLDPLRRLFWSELNHDREDAPLSRRGWPETISSVLAEDPMVLATGADGGFEVIHCRLDSERLSLQAERRVMEKLHTEGHDRALFVFSDTSRVRWHFVNTRYSAEEGRRRLYRRITVGPEEEHRTASERIAMLDLDGMDGASALDFQARHDEAFNVEKVTDEFFKKYAEVFARVESLVEGIAEDAMERRRLFTRRLFNRLMFIAFIQKKGWLSFERDTNYLPALWRAYRRDEHDENFYRDRLKLLFFTGLNTPNEVDVAGINDGGYTGSIFGDVPYLNGGLFERNDDDNDAIVVPDAAIETILEDLFGRFNFTVTESTPLDVEVAVDPEMLGRVFEELVTGRHETGSYYTPKPVVSFMCREALKGHLGARLPNDSPDGVRRFVEDHEPAGLRDPEGALEALRNVTVCDPACGSGAYLLGMLHELLDLRERLFAIRSLDPISNYDRKLEIIQKNLFGVDIDPFAISIARLRLWLSLIVEFEGEKNQKPPLPNLDFKIETGDSLTAPDPSGGLELDMVRDEQVSRLEGLKAAFLKAHGEEKKRLREEIGALRAEVSAWAHPNGKVSGFDWQVEFAEVFAGDANGTAGGFDVILANPPYVRADAQFKHLKDNELARQAAIAEWKSYRILLRSSGVYQTLYEKWDLYIPFLERSYQLLKVNGQMLFIIPDAYNAAKYADKSHLLFLRHANIRRLDFCSGLPIFEAGVHNTIVDFAKGPSIDSTIPIRARRWGDKPSDFDANIEFLSTTSQAEFGAALFRADGTPEAQQTPEGTMALDRICYVSVGMVINADEDKYQGEFSTDELLSDKRDSKHPKRFSLGKDITKWHLRKVRYLEWGTPRAPNHFRRPTFPQLHDAKEKLVSMRTPGREPKTIYDDESLHFDASSVGIVPWHHLQGVVNKSISKAAKYRSQLPDGDREERERASRQFHLKYLLAVANSTFATQWLASARRSKRHIYPDDWKTLPIMPIPMEQQEKLVHLVDAIHAEFERYGYHVPSSAADHVTKLEREIDERVEALYGL